MVPIVDVAVDEIFEAAPFAWERSSDKPYGARFSLSTVTSRVVVLVFPAASVSLACTV